LANGEQPQKKAKRYNGTPVSNTICDVGISTFETVHFIIKYLEMLLLGTTFGDKIFGIFRKQFYQKLKFLTPRVTISPAELII
jgi:hypothetical protein